MTKYTINAGGSSVAIELTEVAGRQAELLDAFGECQEGRCSCPTDEYLKVATMEVQPAEDRIAIQLQAKPGTVLDTAEIAACLGESGINDMLDHECVRGAVPSGPCAVSVSTTS